MALRIEGLGVDGDPAAHAGPGSYAMRPRAGEIDVERYEPV
jgi:hypothetical protein